MMRTSVCVRGKRYKLRMKKIVVIFSLSASSLLFLYHFDEMSSLLSSSPANDTSTTMCAYDRYAFVPLDVVEKDDFCFPTTSILADDGVIQEMVDVRMRTQLWELSFRRPDEDSRSVIKTFLNATVWRRLETTYFMNDEVWSSSKRCNPRNLDPYASPPPRLGRDERVVDEAVLVSSEFVGDEYVAAITEQLIPLAVARDVLSSRGVFVVSQPSRFARAAVRDVLGAPNDWTYVSENLPPIHVRKLHVPMPFVCGYANGRSTRALARWVAQTREDANATEIVVVVADNVRNRPDLARAMRREFPNRTVRVLRSDREFAKWPSRSAVYVFTQTSGAGANVVFLRPGSAAVEIHDEKREPSAEFAQLASVAGVRYAYVGMRSLTPGSFQRDFSTVDVQEVVGVVFRLLGR